MPTFKLQSKLNCYLAKEFLVIPSEHLVSDVRVIENYKIYQQCNIDKNNFI